MNNSNPFAAFSQLNDEMLVVVVIAGIIGVLIGYTILVFYLLTLQNALKQCAVQNQKMTPGQIWLMLIPIFGTFWHFKVVIALADSLAAEFQMRGLQTTEARPGYQIGIAYSILAACGYIQYLGIPGIGQLCGLVGFVCWIIYWVKMSNFKKQLVEHQQFAFGNPNPYPFPNQFPNQPPPPNQYPHQAQNPNVDQPPNQNPFQGPPNQ